MHGCRSLGRGFLPLLLALGLGSPTAGGTDDAAAPEPRRESGLVEEAGRRLIQLDLSVRGPEDAIADLTDDDFALSVGGRSISSFRVDRLCGLPDPVAPARAERSSDDVATGNPVGSSLLFYFDQFHLKAQGRARAMTLARELIPQLITGRHRAMIVSSARQLRTFEDWSSDPERLLRAIDRLEADLTQVDPYPSQEDQRVGHVFDELAAGLDQSAPFERSASTEVNTLSDRVAAIDFEASNGPSNAQWNRATREQQQAYLAQAQMLQKLANGYRGQIAQITEMTQQFQSTSTLGAEVAARSYQQEERWQARMGLARFTATLDRFAEVRLPKAVIYFADTVRPNPGDHYLGLVGARETVVQGAAAVHSLSRPEGQSVHHTSDVSGRSPQTRIPTSHRQVVGRESSTAYEDVINTAAASGVRLYTVQAEGLVAAVAPMPAVALSTSRQSHDPLASSRRLDDAKSGLVGFALETGGQAFLGAAGAERIAAGIRADLSCPFLISFDPQGLLEDEELSTRVWVDVPEVELRYRSRVVVRSASAIKQSQLSTAFLSADRLHDDAHLRIAVIPTGFIGGRYTALVQIIAEGSALAPVTWDLGATLLVKDRIKQEASGRLSINQAHLPIVFEIEMGFAPGPYRVVAVGHQIESDTIVSAQLDGEWPELPAGPAVVGPIAVVQPAYGAFLRDGEQRTWGSTAIGPHGWVDPARPTALVALACRGKGAGRPLTVEHRLEGDSTAEFEPVTIDPSHERCSLLGDLIEAGTLTPGSFAYGVRILGESDDHARGSRTFVAISAEEIALARQDRVDR